MTLAPNALLGAEVECVANYSCVVGENPLWNERTGRIHWIDIETGRLFRADHATLDHDCYYTGEVVGAVAFQEDDSELLFEANRIAVLEQGRRRVLVENIDPDMVRFNDALVDPEGRVYVGSIGKTRESGGLYRVDRDASVTSVWKGTGCANGMGFTGDLTRFYWTCSTTARIFVSDYERATGALSNKRIWYEASQAEGTPDGMTVDASDHVWTARWGGGAVLELGPTATVLGRLELPVPKVSSVAFGGPELDTLYITTAGGKQGTTAPDGSLYRAKVGARGRAGFRSRVGL